MRSIWRGVAAMLCLILLLAGAGGCRRSGSGTTASEGDTAEAVVKLLDDGKTDDALYKARRAALDDPSLAGGIASELVAWADGRTAEEPAFTIYLTAVELAPGAAGGYVGLGRLQESFREGLGAEKCLRALSLWRKADTANPGLRREARVCLAVSALANGAGDYPLAADLAPDDGEAQLLAALSFTEPGEASRSLPYARRAHGLIGDRTDTLMALAVGGALRPVEVDGVTDVEIPCKAGRVLGVAAGLVYVLCSGDQQYRIIATDLENGGTRTIVSSCGPGAALSPDGSCLAYGTAAEWDQPCSVEVIDLAAGNVRALAETVADVSSIAWSPDSAQLAIASRQGLVVVGRDGSATRLLVPHTGADIAAQGPIEPAWSPDGSRIAFGQGLWEGSGPVSVIDLENAKVTVVTPSSAHGARWLSDRQIIFAIESYGGFDGVIRTKDFATTPDSGIALTAGRTDAHLLTLSPGSDQALLQIGLCCPGMPPFRSFIWSVKIPGGQLTLLPVPESGVGSMYWDPDGTIYYCAGGHLVGFRPKG